MATRTIGTGETTPWDPLTNRKNEKKNSPGSSRNLWGRKPPNISFIIFIHETWKDTLKRSNSSFGCKMADSSSRWRECRIFEMSSCVQLSNTVASNWKQVQSHSIRTISERLWPQSFRCISHRWSITLIGCSAKWISACEKNRKIGIAHWDCHRSIHDFTYLLQLLLNFHLCLFCTAIFDFLNQTCSRLEVADSTRVVSKKKTLRKRNIVWISALSVSVCIDEYRPPGVFPCMQAQNIQANWPKVFYPSWSCMGNIVFGNICSNVSLRIIGANVLLTSQSEGVTRNQTACQ